MLTMRDSMEFLTTILSGIRLFFVTKGIYAAFIFLVGCLVVIIFILSESSPLLAEDTVAIFGLAGLFLTVAFCALCNHSSAKNNKLKGKDES